MAFSLIVLLIPVVLIVLAYRNIYGGDTVVTVDPTNRIASALRAGLTPPPATAPEGWQIIAAQFQDGTLRLGFIGPKNEAVQLVQSKTSADTLINAELTTAGTKLAQTTLEGRSWERWTGRPGEEALVLRISPSDTVILVGHGGDLTQFATWFF
jgi:hypothetical protein